MSWSNILNVNSYNNNALLLFPNIHTKKHLFVNTINLLKYYLQPLLIINIAIKANQIHDVTNNFLASTDQQHLSPLQKCILVLLQKQIKSYKSYLLPL